MNVQHATVTSHTTDRHAAVKAALAVDVKHYADRMSDAIDAGDKAEAERCAQLAGGSAVLAIDLGITAEEFRSAVAVHARGTR